MKSDYLEKVRLGENLRLREQTLLVLRLSIPAILAQISTIVMEYIDASMVGSLGADASASIGIVSTTTWLIGGVCSAIGIGFTVGIAHRIGAGDDTQARAYVRTGLLTVVLFAVILMVVSILIHKRLPVLMGGNEAVVTDASRYFLVYALTLPIMQINYTGAGMLECSGNMKLPSIIHVLMCFLDIVFNSLLIYDSKIFVLSGIRFHGAGITVRIPGAGLGVTGAALGTMCAQVVGAVCILLSVLVFSDKLSIRKKEKGKMTVHQWSSASKISLPVMLSSLIMGSAYVLSTKVVAPLGNVSISANSFAITAESLCYMPGYGVAHAATTLVGQTKGAGNHRMEQRFSYLTTVVGIGVMTMAAVLLYVFAPQMIAILSPDAAVRELGAKILRIEAFAEPMFGASIVVEGIFRGMGKTGISSALNLASMWFVRLPLSALVVASYGLTGVWYVMCAELIFRGILFLVALFRVFHSRRF